MMIMPNKIDFSEVASFDKSTLKKSETNEQNSLPDKEVMEEEKAQAGNSAATES